MPLYRREENTLWASENKMLDIKEWTSLHNDGHHNLYFPHIIIHVDMNKVSHVPF
jgi:hypothetical protein